MRQGIWLTIVLLGSLSASSARADTIGYTVSLDTRQLMDFNSVDPATGYPTFFWLQFTLNSSATGPNNTIVIDHFDLGGGVADPVVDVLNADGSLSDGLTLRPSPFSYAFQGFTPGDYLRFDLTISSPDLRDIAPDVLTLSLFSGFFPTAGDPSFDQYDPLTITLSEIPAIQVFGASLAVRESATIQLNAPSVTPLAADASAVPLPQTVWGGMALMGVLAVSVGRRATSRSRMAVRAA